MARRILHDRYFKQAKREGYLARSAYKLIELDDARRILARGQRVIDLGCAPGSWLQVAGERVGSEGLVVGIDLLPVAGVFPPNVRTLVADFTTVSVQDLLPGGSPADVVLSDMAPNTSGHGDHFRSIRLCETILDAMPILLRPGGSLVMKVFEGEAFPPLLARVRNSFSDVKVIKPRATRDPSRETYITARRFRPPRAATNPEPPRTDGGGA
jgi:23S rRNA (uridine2552-2'-O)-methyltransferase